MLDQKNRFIIEDYRKQKTFSSFLPGIAGLCGIPLWSFYVNRGQGICSFGSHDKQHPIMEFFPAHTSYQLAGQRGFRTFLKVNGTFYEPFSSENIPSSIAIGKNELEISEVNEELGIQIRVNYFILPDERIGALARCLSIKNLGEESITIECMDGLPALVPFGVTLRDMKEVTQLIQAWIQVEHVEEQLPFYHLLASSDDTTQVSEIQAGNFYAAFDREGKRLPVIVDPELIFQYDTQLNRPVAFQHMPLKELIRQEQSTSNQMPSGFGCLEQVLERGGECKVNSLIGHASQYSDLISFIGSGLGEDYFSGKEQRAIELTEEMAEQIHTETASKTFDAYCDQTYIDNLLRGGYPVQLAEGKPFYAYSRKHGDLERDYNTFSMLPEFYSQGNGNYRDVNQNRRNDLIFAPFVKDYNIKRFYELVQLDGYNPLVLTQSEYRYSSGRDLFGKLPEGRRNEIESFLQRPFTPGQLAMFLREEEHPFFEKIIQNSEEYAGALLSEGYWTDHWTYNLDLVEAYLGIYPEETEQLLFKDRTYRYYDARAYVLPRRERYEKTDAGLRQFRSIAERENVSSDQMWVHGAYGSGAVYRSSLMEKMLLLSALKFSTLDIRGRGIEMEGGKPGWYDALNGLPALFGSSMCETYELKRQLLFLSSNLSRYPHSLRVPLELGNLISELGKTMKDYFGGTYSRMEVWNRSSSAKEQYRECIQNGISGEEQTFTGEMLQELIRNWLAYLDEGIQSALEENNGIPPAYCAYHIRDFEEKDGRMEFRDLEDIRMPDFLEGSVRYLKLPGTLEEKRELYQRVKGSELYDRKLKMYKVNTSLESSSHEIGRTRAFNRGWLENESIWLHMEYKYLLELLKSGLYEEFFEDMKSACIPFMEFETYGRSLTENSSFIVSSVHPNKKLHGRGYMARLSGSTAEFLQMWQLMFLGSSLIQNGPDGICCRLLPAIPEYLIPENGVVRAKLFGVTRVVYHAEGLRELMPGRYDVVSYTLKYYNGTEKMRTEMGQEETIALRAGEIREISLLLREREGGCDE